MAAKIKDVAKKANVSIATVSRVINNIPLVNEETRQKVLDAIRETGYKPNAIARSLKLQRTDTIGVIIHDITRTYYTLTARAIGDVCSNGNYNIVLCNTDGKEDRELAMVDLLVSKQCDGIIYLGKKVSDALKAKFAEYDVPIVLAAVQDKEGELCSVHIDNEAASYDMVKYIASMGHKKIGFINAPKKEAYFANRRYNGFMKAVREFDLTVRDEWVKEADFSYKGGSKAMESICKCGELPTVVFCANDDMAVGAVRYLESIGKKVPDDVSICGFNNFDSAKWNSPRLTTIDSHMYDVGAVCASVVFSALDGEESVSKETIISYDIVEGESLKRLS